METRSGLSRGVMYASMCALLFLFHLGSWAAESKSEEAPKTTKTKDLSFEDLLVSGKYHFSDEAVVTVEQDKVLDGLLGIRKDFKDRLAQSANQR